MSKKIKELFEKGLYESILAEQIDVNDAEDLLFNILSLEATYKYEEALNEYYKSREKVEKWDLISSSKALFFLLIYFKRYDDLEKEKEHFKSLPYVNQKTEEYLNGMDEYLKQLKEYFEQSDPNKDASINNIKEMLSSGVKEEKLYAIKKLFELESQGVSCKDVVVNYLETNMSFDSSYSLLLEYAMYAKVNKRITFKKNNRYYSIIPGDYYTYVSLFEKLLSSKLKEMSMTEKNISIFNYVSVIARPAFIYCLPDEIEENDLDSFIGALIKSACKMYSVSLNDDNYYKELNITKNKMDKYSDIVAIIESEY